MLFKRPNSRRWWVRIITPDGKKVRQSSGTEDKKAAEEYEAALKTQLWRQERLGEKPSHTWQAAVVRWIEETHHKASHEDDLSHLRWPDPILKGKLLEDVDRDTLDDVLKKCVREGWESAEAKEKGMVWKGRKLGPVSNATCNRTTALVRSILRKAAREWAWIAQAPAARMLPEPKRRIRWLTREQADHLMSYLPEHLLDMVQFSLATGLREANVTGLCWSQVDLDRRVAWCHADEMKGEKAIAVPLNTDAMRVLRRRVGLHQERVFTYKGEPIIKAGSTAWKKALERAGIEDFRWHDLRHTWANWYVQAGTPLHVLQELGGGVLQRW